MPSVDHSLCSDTTGKRTPSGDPDSALNLNPYASANSSSSESGMRANPRRCSVPDCQKTAKRGGRCIGHGGGNKCAVEGCTTSVVSRGLCVAHGGGKRCQTPECTKSAQSGGFCWVHGGGKKCGYRGCPKRAQSGGACIAHGGGKRCRFDGCNKVVQYDGLCVGHGGYRRCISDQCENRAMANNYCQQHGGSSVCALQYCYKRAVRGGMCSEHKAEASQQAVTASGLSTPSQSSDDGREQRARNTRPTFPGYQVQHSRWQSIVDSDKFASRPSLETRSPNSMPRRFLEDDTPSTPAPTRPRVVMSDRRTESPLAPGISALLNAEDRHPPFSTYTRKLEPTERLVRHHYTRHHQEHKVYPILPRLEALHTYRNTGSPDTKSSRGTVLGSSPGVRSSQPEVRIVLTKDHPRPIQTPSKDCNFHVEDERDEYVDKSPTRSLYMQTHYSRKNDGMPRSSTPPQLHDWSRRHT